MQNTAAVLSLIKKKQNSGGRAVPEKAKPVETKRCVYVLRRVPTDPSCWLGFLRHIRNQEHVVMRRHGWIKSEVSVVSAAGLGKQRPPPRRRVAHAEVAPPLDAAEHEAAAVVQDPPTSHVWGHWAGSSTCRRCRGTSTRKTTAGRRGAADRGRCS
jgi:hypothetical protein